MKLGYTLVILCLSTLLIGQVTNPFDIPNRSVEVPLITTIDTLVEDTITKPVEAFAPVDVNQVVVPTVSTDQNPFDLGSHPGIESPTSKSSRIEAELDTPLVHTDTGSAPLKSKTGLLVLIFFLVMLIVLSLAVSLDRKRSTEIFKSVVNSNSLKTLYRENNAWSNGQTILLYLSFFLIGSFLIWLMIYKSDLVRVHLWWVALGLLGCYGLRHVIMWTLSVVFPLRMQAGQYNYSIMIHNVVLGILLLPIVLAIEFVPGISVKSYAMIFAFIVMLIYLLRQAKGILGCISMRGFNPLYFFIYLCAVEIAPVMVLYKVIVGAM